MKNTDLHTHSYYSDGQLAPEELIRLAKKKRIKNIALTDHNSVKGVEEAIKEGKKIGVNVIPAVEITAREGEILSYYINYKNRQLKKELKNNSYYQNEKIRRKLEKLKDSKYNLSYIELKRKFPNAEGNYNISHVWASLLDKRFKKKEFEKFLKKIKIKKPKKKEATLVQAIRIARKYGAIPVLAHPWLDKKVLKDKNFKKYIKAGLKGIESDNGDRNSWGRNKSVVKKIKKFAKKYNLIITLGSDYHQTPWMKGKGHILGNTLVDEKVIKQLKACF